MSAKIPAKFRPPPPPLTIDELRAIQARNRDPDVRALLWEVHRLHHMLVRSHTVVSMAPVSSSTWGGAGAIIQASLLDALGREPAVIARREWTEDLLNPGGKSKPVASR